MFKEVLRCYLSRIMLKVRVSAMKLCESLYSREEVISTLEGFIGDEIKPSTYINDSKTMRALRERINEMIIAKV